MNLPDYNFISAPLWLITALHIITLSLHLIAMNFMFGGLIVILTAKIKNRWEEPAIQRFVKLLPTVMAATVTLGVAPLLFVQLVFSKEIYSASIVSGWFWLMIFMVAMVTYYFLYGASFSKKPGRISLYLVLAMLGMFYISFVYSSTFALAENPTLSRLLYAGNQSGLIINPDVGSYLFRWVHILLGSITVGAFFVGWIGKDSEKVFSVAKSYFLYGMVVTMVVGFAYMMTLGENLIPFMRSAGIWAITLSLILSLGSLHFFFKKKFSAAALMILVSVIGMVVARHSLRLINLSGHFDPSTIAVKPEWALVTIFMICFIVAIGAIAYMLKLFLKSQPK